MTHRLRIFILVMVFIFATACVLLTWKLDEAWQVIDIKQQTIEVYKIRVAQLERELREWREKPAREVVKEVEVVKYIEVVKEISMPVELKDWESVEELDAFLKEDDTDSHSILVADQDGVINFSGQCEDVALQLRDRAMAIGKHLSVVPLDSAEYYKWYDKHLPYNQYHTICMAKVGSNEFYYIDPVTDRRWLALYLD